MTPEQERMLRESLTLARENNEAIKKLYRSMVVGRVIKVVYWVILIGAAIGAFYFVQPYVDTIKSIYGGVGDPQEALQSFFGF